MTGPNPEKWYCSVCKDWFYDVGQGDHGHARPPNPDERDYLLENQQYRISSLEHQLSSGDTIGELLLKLVEAGCEPVLHYTPLRAGLKEDAFEPEPRWCCHDAALEMWHEHGDTPVEAIKGLYDHWMKTR